MVIYVTDAVSVPVKYYNICVAQSCFLHWRWWVLGIPTCDCAAMAANINAAVPPDWTGPYRDTATIRHSQRRIESQTRVLLRGASARAALAYTTLPKHTCAAKDGAFLAVDIAHSPPEMNE